MKYNVKYTKMAAKDLDRVWDEVYDASKSYDVAEKYINELMDETEKRADYPKGGSPLIYDSLFTGYYFVVFKAYIAFYHIDDHDMIVDRILFGASDYIRVLKLK